MHSDRSRSSLAAQALLCAWLAVGIASAAAPRYAGQTVTNALAKLSDSGLHFVYSSELVPDSLVIGREPRSRDRLRVANEILAEFGLSTRAVRGDLYVIVRKQQAMQARSLTGQILDAESGGAVPTARVELRPLGVVRVTDADGRFAFSSVPASSYALYVSAPDYGASEHPTNLANSDEQQQVTVRIARAQLTEVVVATSRYRIGALADDSAIRMTRTLLSSQPSLAGDPLRAANRLPGFAQDGVSAPPNIRGGEAAEVLALLDGFPLRQAYHLPGYQSLFSILDDNVIDSMEVYTGGFGARYGNRLAGVFDLHSIESTGEPQNSLGISFVNAHARVARVLPEQHADFLLAGRIGTLGPVLAALSPNSARPNYSDAFARFTIRPLSQLALSANALWARDELSINDDDERADFASRSSYVWLQAQWLAREELSAKVWLGQSQINLRRIGTVDKEDFFAGTAQDLRYTKLTDLRGQLEWRPAENHQAAFGVEWTTAAGNYDYHSRVQFSEPAIDLFASPTADSRDIALDTNTHRLALFASDRWRIGERWVAELGLRAQRSSLGAGRAESSVDPRFALRWGLTPSTRLRLNWGRFHQADEAHELRVEDGVVAPQRARRSEHWVLGLEHDWQGGLRLRAEAFVKHDSRPRIRFENSLTRLELVPELTPDREVLVPDSADMRGVEVSLNLERDSWSSWLSVTNSTATDRFATRKVPRSWDQRWALQSGIDWRCGPWAASAAFSWHSGWPATLLSIDADGDAQLGDRNGTRLPAYASLDLRGEYRRPLPRGSLLVSLQVSNVTNRRNVCCSDLNVQQNVLDEAILVSEPTVSFPLLPSLAIKWQF